MQWSRLDRWWLSAWIFPLISALTWLGMLLALFCVWEAEGAHHLPSMNDGQTIAYISDTGAFGLKPLFIAGSAVTVVFLNLSLLAERWLRHYGRLAPTTSRSQSILSSIAIFFAMGGACGLIFLSIFDTYRHNRVHNGCLLLFIGGYVLSAIFLCAEYQRLGIHYRQHRILAISFWVKLAFILTEVALAIVFAATSWNNHENVAAVFEWIVALVFTFWVLSFILDLWPSVRSRSRVPQGFREAEAALEKEQEHSSGLSSVDQTPPPVVAQPNQQEYNDVNGSYRGTNMTGGQGSHLQNATSTFSPQNNDLGRQKKWGVGRFRF